MVATHGGWHRRLVRAGAGAAMITVMAGCSSDGGTPTAAGSTPPPAASSGTATGTPAATPPAASGTGPASTAPATQSPAPGPKTATASPGGNQRPVLNNLPGNPAAGSCVAVGDQRDLRSGTMGAGNFVTARKAFADQAKTKSQPSVPLYLIPSNATGLSTVVVTLRKGGTSRTATFKEQQYAEDWLYFPVRLSIPSAGTWQITATSGSNTGCFSVAFGG